MYQIEIIQEGWMFLISQICFLSFLFICLRNHLVKIILVLFKIYACSCIYHVLKQFEKMLSMMLRYSMIIGAKPAPISLRINQVSMIKKNMVMKLAHIILEQRHIWHCWVNTAYFVCPYVTIFCLGREIFFFISNA